MRFKRVETEGLVQYSYFIADKGNAVVIDPRFDINIYLELAKSENAKIQAIFETHRNEDMLSGGKFLAEVTGAPVYRSGYEDPGYKYGEEIKEGFENQISDEVMVSPVHTPGHTLGHLGYLLKFKQNAYMFFSGDCLFYGGVGRTDFYGPKNLDKMTRLQFASIYKKALPIGSEVILMPAHGSGSVCGASLEKRPHSTLGYERKHNPYLSSKLERFIDRNAKLLPKNPYFTKMEKRNLEGAGVYRVPLPPVVKDYKTSGLIIDLRDRVSFSAGHLPGSLNVPADGLTSFLGWLVETEEHLTIMADTVSDHLVEQACTNLARTGFDNVCGIFREDTLNEYTKLGKKLHSTKTTSVEDFIVTCKKQGKGKKLFAANTLDLRQPDEYEKSDIVQAEFEIPFQSIKDKGEEIKTQKEMYILCGTGERSMIAASYLRNKYNLNCVVVLGGMEGINKYLAQ